MCVTRDGVGRRSAPLAQRSLVHRRSSAESRQTAQLLTYRNWRRTEGPCAGRHRQLRQGYRQLLSCHGEPPRRGPKTGEGPELPAQTLGHETCSQSPAATSSMAMVQPGRRHRPPPLRTTRPPPAGRHLMSVTTSEQVARTQPHDPLLTVAQAGDYLGTGERFIRRLIAERRVTYVKL